MGDRCDVWLTFGGHISKRSAEALVAQLKEDGFHCDMSGKEPSLDNLGETFTCEEVNYANTDDIEAVCTEHGICFEKYHSAGGDYGAGKSKFAAGVYMEFSCDDGEPVIPLSRILDVEKSVDTFAKLLGQAKFMREALPPLLIDPDMPCPADTEETADAS